MADSILEDVKKLMNLDPSYDVFDRDLILHVNSVFSTLTQLGVGPPEGFIILDDVGEWTDFLSSDNRLNAVKSYVYLRVRLLFDPPATSFGITALENQAREMEWRLQVAVDPVQITGT